MSQLFRALIVVAALSLLPLVSHAEDVVLEGSFDWRNNKDQPLTGTFTPAGEGKWTVRWDFKWKDRPTVYTGELTGSLTDGDFEGFATTANGRRKWVFEGKAEGGVLKASQKEIKKRNGEEQMIDCGTFTVGPGA